MAHALPRAGLGARQGARHALQHRRRHPHGARHRREPYGNWSGCHAVAWERNAPEFGDLAVGDQFQKHSYPFGIMINAEGKRFVDEGADFRNYTYAKYGRVVLQQPGQFAWQIFDAKVKHLLRDEYRIRQVTKVAAEHARGAAPEARRRERRSIPRDHRANTTPRCAPIFRSIPTSRTGGAPGARRQQDQLGEHASITPPFEAYAVTCGITFTFGGLRINTDAAGARHRLPARSPACTPPASWSAGCSTSTIRAAPA